MGNISDNLRDFTERPYVVKTWEKKTEFTLTLSVILKLQGNNEIINKIEVLRDEILTQLNQPNWYYSNNPYRTNGIYRYLKDNFHFSLINFLKYNVNSNFSSFEEGFSNFRVYIRKRDDYQETVEKLKQKLHSSLPNQTDAYLRWIETGDKDRAFDSFSLQVFPDIEFIKKLEEIEEEFKERQKEIFKVEDGVDIKLKAYPKENRRRFSVNVLRFIYDNNELKNEEIKIKTKNIVETLNRKHNDKNWKTIKINRLSLVESDPFLFNKEPEIEKFYI